MIQRILLPLLSILCLAAAPLAPWPTIHKDNQRSAFTPELIPGPYERKWFRDFHDEMIATRVEAILAEGKCFVGTFAGNFYALDVNDGHTVWVRSGLGPIGASACFHNGRILVGSDRGILYCMNAATGDDIWRFDASASIWVAPATDGQSVYFGDRAGVFHAVSLQDGKEQWTYRTSGMILTPASTTADGARIIFGSEDMHLYCLARDGKLLWKSRKLQGLSMRDHAPTLWQGLAIVTTNPPIGFHHAAGESPAILTAAQKALPMEGDDKVVFDKWGSYVMKLTPRRLKAEQEAILKFLKDNPHQQTFYAFDLETGKEPWTAPILYTAGLHNPPTPPTFNPNTGELYAWAPSALSNYSAGVPGGAIAVAKIDRKTGLTQILYHTNGDRLGWAFDFCAPADETQALSMMDGLLLNTHQGIVGGMKLDSLKWQHIYIARDTYGGIFGPAVVPGSFKGADKLHAEGQLTLMPNEWHGPDRAIVSIGENRLFWLAGSQVVCLGGPAIPRADTGGTKAPPPIQRKHKPVVPAGNVAASGVGTFDASISKPNITVEQMRKYLAPPAQRLIGGHPLVQPQLEHALGEVIHGMKPLAPLVIELGISGEDRYFWRSSETMQILALADQFSSIGMSQDLGDYLERLWDSHCPLTNPIISANENRRELYDLGPEMLNFARSQPKYSPSIEDLYAVWAYAHFAAGWEKVLAKRDTIRNLFDAFASKPVQFNHADKDSDAAAHLNAQIAGVLAYARIMQHAKNAEQVERALKLLAELVSIRIHHELADTRFVRETRTSSYKLHQATIPRYLDLTPEVAQMLREFAGEALARNLANLRRDLPVWHHAFGERLIGGENYISSPTLARGLFMAWADGTDVPVKDLAAHLDQPWCRADLYYIEKLTAILRRASAGRRE